MIDNTQHSLFLRHRSLAQRALLVPGMLVGLLGSAAVPAQDAAGAAAGYPAWAQPAPAMNYPTDSRGSDNLNHEFFYSSHAPWTESDGSPINGMEMTAYMAGQDETHTLFPTSAARISGKADMLAGIAALQVVPGSVIDFVTTLLKCTVVRSAIRICPTLPEPPANKQYFPICVLPAIPTSPAIAV